MNEALYVVTDRGTNDNGCGGAYSAGNCYFFLESTYYQGPVAKFVGSWGGNFTSMSKVRFIDEHTVIFDAEAGDAGMSVEEVWSLDITIGSTSMLSRTVTDIE